MSLDNEVFRRAVIRHFGIRESYVKLKKVDILHQSPGRKLLSTITQSSARRHVIWLPSVASTKKNSATALSALEAYRNGGFITVFSPEKHCLFLFLFCSSYTKYKASFPIVTNGCKQKSSKWPEDDSDQNQCLKNARPRVFKRSPLYKISLVSWRKGIKHPTKDWPLLDCQVLYWY